MRKVNKPSEIPTKLLKVHNLIAEELYVKKDKFDWRDEHYNTPIKEELRDKIYYKKCGYCEIKLVEYKCDEEFTIEHFRPKKHYYWLGAEWTNLFPVCSKCNNNKGDEFSLQLEYSRIKKEYAPFDSNGSLIFSKCLVDSDELLSEKPLYLHPEIDEPLHFFEVNKDGILYLKNDLDKFEQRRGKHMLDKLLETERLEHARKKVIDKAKEQLEREIRNFIEYSSNSQDNTQIKLSFFSFFKMLFTLGDKEQEFSLVGYYMNENFEDFFLDEYESSVQDLIKYAYSLFLEEISKNNS
ncbi:HNH endonuclease [Bernardetia sp. MNP-M8]|uniref:HNH endonuclease n=1 Tax=Bernardetia sp. MNP-M8 TaxID=3127470 RepID=UPI0030D5FB32